MKCIFEKPKLQPSGRISIFLVENILTIKVDRSYWILVLHWMWQQQQQNWQMNATYSNNDK